MKYKLLTPGPLTTSTKVREVMNVDHCTWDNDYKVVTQEIREGLLKIAHASSEKYTTVLMQGSGTFGVESVLTSVVGEDEKVLIITNGLYGKRMVEIVETAKVNFTEYEVSYSEIPKASDIKNILDSDESITHVAMVHCETTSGIINDIASVTKVVKDAGRTMIVDAMSSFGGVDIEVEKLGIDVIVSSANKCIQGVPGFSFIICSKETLTRSAGKARSMSLDLYAQWKGMDRDGKWRFTSPTHVVLAFRQAMEELFEEGGVTARYARYKENNDYLINTMKEIGFGLYIEECQSPIITTFISPTNEEYSFEDMYAFIKERGYAIYPGKVTDADTFRIGNIGEIYLEDMVALCDIFKEYMGTLSK